MYLVENSKASAWRRVIRGRALVHRRLNARRRAAIAAQLFEGEVVIDLSMRQLAQLIGVSAAYIHAARQLSPAKREAIANGTDSTPFTTLLPSSKPLALPKPVSDTQLVDIIKGVGIDRVLSVACTVE